MPAKPVTIHLNSSLFGKTRPARYAVTLLVGQRRRVLTATIGTAFERTSALPCPLVTDGKCLTGTLQLLAAAGSLSPEATASS